ncbi:MFS transporter, partial [Streptomyces sp. 2MCAF27]
ALTPMATTFFIASLMGPRLVSRYGNRVVTAGAVIQAIGITLLILTVHYSWTDLSLADLLPGIAVAGLGQGLQLPVLIRGILAEVPAERAGVGSGVMVTTQQSALALGVATLGTLFLTLTPSMGMGDAMVRTLALQLAGVVVTGLLSLRLPRMLG